MYIYVYNYVNSRCWKAVSVANHGKIWLTSQSRFCMCFLHFSHRESEAKEPSYDGMLQCNLTMSVHQYVWCQVPFEDFFVFFVLLFDYVLWSQRVFIGHLCVCVLKEQTSCHWIYILYIFVYGGELFCSFTSHEKICSLNLVVVLGIYYPPPPPFKFFYNRVWHCICIWSGLVVRIYVHFFLFWVDSIHQV